MSLFDQIARSDGRPAAYAEDSFSFLNRVNRPFWANVRDELESWFTTYPSEHAADLRARFRSADPRQHHAAWWELYLYRLFDRVGWVVEVHPDVASTTHPDFRLTSGTNAFYLEALTVFSGIVEEARSGPREAWILDLINEVTSPNFFVGVDFNKVGLQRPRRGEVVRPIEGWLASLDPDATAAAIRAGAEPPELPLQFRDWDVVIEALPVKSEARGKPDHRVVGRGPVSGGFINDVEQLQRGLSRKFRHYGELEDPLLVAVLGMSSFLELRDVEQALYGRHAVQYEQQPPYHSEWVRLSDGVWRGPRGPRGRSVAGVLSAAGIQPTTVVRDLPRLWLNPWATRPLQVELPFPTTAVNDTDELVHGDASATGAELLGLLADWPGPEAAFD